MTPSGQTLTNDQLVLELEGKLQCSICLLMTLKILLINFRYKKVEKSTQGDNLNGEEGERNGGEWNSGGLGPFRGYRP